MQYLSWVLYFLSFIFVGDIYSQEIGSHQWEHRILVISVDDLDNELYQAQMAELQNSKIDLQERKLIVYQVNGLEYRNGISKSGKWTKINNRELSSILDQAKLGFGVILIGLDGGVKLRQSAILTKEALFSIIDGMPMRKREIRTKEGG